VKKHLESADTLSTESLDTKKDGSRFHVSSKIRWINYNNENHILAIIRDISDKKANEMELVKAKEKAEESDQLKSSFLANMSHEIRTPMNSIIGFSNLLEEPDISEDEKSSFISRIKNNSQQLLRLINDIIDISKIEANQVKLVFSEIQMNHFLQEMYELFELQANNKNIDFKYECHDMDPIRHFKSDINRLTQIITNLMSNSLKFTPEGGQIVLGSYPSSSTHEIILYVKDSGIGIQKEAQQHIFHRFRQAHDMTQTEYGGTGLGLSIVKGLVESMKGRIWLESNEGSGSQFFIALPHDFSNDVL
jgi:signal transduction histidine kinase